jgi:hypothetical protein
LSGPWGEAGTARGRPRAGGPMGGDQAGQEEVYMPCWSWEAHVHPEPSQRKAEG